MKHLPSSLTVVAATGALLLSVGPLAAATLAVPNFSFESPATAFYSINIDSWQKPPQPPGYQTNGGFLWIQLTGIFANTSSNSPDHIDNCDGNQAMWLFADPDVGLFQDYDSVDWHGNSNQFDAIFVPGKSYHLTTGIIGTGGGMRPGATLDLSLYFRDSGTNLVTVGVTTVTNVPEVFSNNTHFVDCTLDVPAVKATDAWAGRHIGIRFLSTVDTNLQGGYWDLDNVRLSAVTEPVLQNPFWTNDQFGFTLVGEPGMKFEILAATNLNLPASNWMIMGTLTNDTGARAFTDATASPSAQYYRAHQLP